MKTREKRKPEAIRVYGGGPFRWIIAPVHRVGGLWIMTPGYSQSECRTRRGAKAAVERMSAKLGLTLVIGQENLK